MANKGGVAIKFDTAELIKYSEKMVKAQRVTNIAVAQSLNHVGDELVSILSSNLSRQTSLSLEQVRGLLRIKRATRNNLNYDIAVPEGLVSEREARVLEGRREKGFGPFKPGQMVIIVTKKDELVCMDCEELGAAGPMPVEKAMEHVPKHPHCRCVIMPYVEKGRRLPVTMTSLSGSDPIRRSGRDESSTLRQLAQEILDRTARGIRVELR